VGWQNSGDSRWEIGVRLSVFGDRGRKEEVHRLTQILTDEEKPGIGFQTHSVGSICANLCESVDGRSVFGDRCSGTDEAYRRGEEGVHRWTQIFTGEEKLGIGFQTQSVGFICANLCESVDGRSVFGQGEEGVHRLTQISTDEEKPGIGFQTQSVGSICANLCESVDGRSVFGDRCSGTAEAYWRAEEGVHRLTQIFTDEEKPGIGFQTQSVGFICANLCQSVDKALPPCHPWLPFTPGRRGGCGSGRGGHCCR
jgi:hypothetical protein